jgi:hypothetical protein
LRIARDSARSIPSDACPALQGIGGTSAAISSREVFARSFASRQRCPHSSQSTEASAHVDAAGL